jgi:putative transposase
VNTSASASRSVNVDGVRKTFKYRLKPTPEQERALETVLWRCRTLYNAALEERKTAWERSHVVVTYFEQKAELPDLKRACPEFAEVHAHILQDVILRVERAFQAFFRRVQAGEEPGYPRFQGRGRYSSFTFPEYGNGAVLDGRVLSLSKIGRVPIRVHRPLQGTPKTVIISREADGWYACLSCVEVLVEPLPMTGKETGIDVGLKVFLINANGEIVENPRHYRNAETQLKKAQRRVSGRKKGSMRRRKAVAQLKRTHQKVARQRRDFHHKTALALVRQYDVIYLEDLQVRNLRRRPAPVPDGTGGYQRNGANAKAGLNRSIHDAGWYAFRTILACKAAWAGKRVEAVPPAYTSQDCSGCGARVQKSLSVRMHVCPTCGLILDRDENAARNIQWAGQALRGVVGIPAALNREVPCR